MSFGGDITDKVKGVLGREAAVGAAGKRDSL